METVFDLEEHKEGEEVADAADKADGWNVPFPKTLHRLHRRVVGEILTQCRIHLGRFLFGVTLIQNLAWRCLLFLVVCFQAQLTVLHWLLFSGCLAHQECLLVGPDPDWPRQDFWESHE